jgi:hypothetical protein
MTNVLPVQKELISMVPDVFTIVQPVNIKKKPIISVNSVTKPVTIVTDLMMINVFPVFLQDILKMENVN